MVYPNGWIKNFLSTQMRGLTGNMEKAGFPFDRIEWGQPDIQTDNENPQWWVYEQVAYWMDGAIRCGIALGNTQTIDKIAKIIYNVLDDPDEDGYLGPKFLKITDGWNRWPHVVFFRSCMALYEYNGDEKIVAAMKKHYLCGDVSYGKLRDVLNVEIMLWLYGKTGDARLLDLAERSYSDYNAQCKDDLCEAVALSEKKPRAHGVSYNEYSKLGAILYAHTGKEKYLQASIRAVEKIDKYFMLVSGCHCSDEFMIANDYYRSSETCDVSDYTWNLFYLLRATKNPVYADKIERCIFNAGMGCVLEDFKALQYFSCANQLVLDGNSNHNAFFKGSEWMSYRPNPGTECCPGNVNRFMPNYVLNSWHVDGKNVYAFVYGAGTFDGEVDGKNVKIVEETQYPIVENVKFTVQTQTAFTFFLRIPAWASGYKLMLDGKEIVVSDRKQYIGVEIAGDCVIELAFESEIIEHKKENTVWYSKGALTYSLGMKGERRTERRTDGFYDYAIYPDKEWRYGIVGGRYAFTGCKAFDSWDLDLALPYIEVPARRIQNWDFERKNVVRRCINLYENKYKIVRKDCTFTPKLLKNKDLCLAQETETIRLYPYGACKVRLTVFNLLKE